MNADTPILKIRNLAVSFADEDKRVMAVSDVSLTVYPSQTVAVVGESGCGKSVSALSTLQLVPVPPGRYDRGQIFWTGDPSDPEAFPDEVDLLTLSDKEMRHVRGNQIAMIFQEPMTSLNPVYTIGDQIVEAVRLHQKVTRRDALGIAEKAVHDVGIGDPASRLREYPHQMSGGMRQRVMIAMALACQPRLLLADEPTTALDVTIQAQILELLRGLQLNFGMSIMLITHDLGVVAQNADVVGVMYAGRIVEYGNVNDVFYHPLHPYTHGLFESMPVLGKERDELVIIEGQVPTTSSRYKEYAVDKEGNQTKTLVAADPALADVIMKDGKPMRVFRRSADEQPPLLEVQPGHWVACWATPGFANGKPTVPDLNFRREATPVAAPATA
jgi:ABC-type dipeptide/oligopeptide/nickel transport system ATPase component